MPNLSQLYINGRWVDPEHKETLHVINPATETAIATLALAGVSDVDKAVQAARRAFASYSALSVAARLELLDSIIAEYRQRWDDMADAITQEMGSPVARARKAQTALGLVHLKSARQALETFAFERTDADVVLRHEPIGVCGLITPWNWPMNQVAAKVAPALAAGCTVVLKPSEESPLSAAVWTEILHTAGVPAGVFNLVHGQGALAGEAIASHPDIDMVSFTGSTRAGVAVAKAAAESVKRVCQELGGKSAAVVLPDADIATAVRTAIKGVMDNSGQSCNAPTRLLIPQDAMAEAVDVAKATAESLCVGDPQSTETALGPLVNGAQYRKVVGLIETGIREGATLVTGGVERPDGVGQGYYVKPTVFADVDNQMTIAREEIFGPVVCMIPYDTEDDAIRIANDTPYGLAAYVASEDPAHALAVARQLRAGQVSINFAYGKAEAPFGGYKQSGNGREKGVWGLQEYLEIKGVLGVADG